VAKFFTKSPIGGRKYRLPVILNIRNPKVFAEFIEDDEKTYGLAEMYVKNGEKDGIINGTEGKTRTEYIAFKPEQIHILSKSEVEKLKKINANYDAELAALKSGAESQDQVAALKKPKPKATPKTAKKKSWKDAANDDLGRMFRRVASTIGVEVIGD